MKIIRASEVGTWLFCARAWWYQRQGVPSSNQAGMDRGISSHVRHGHRLFASTLLRILAWLALVAAVLLALISLPLSQ